MHYLEKLICCIIEGISEKEMASQPSIPCLENSMDRGIWQATVHGVTESDTTEHTHAQREYGYRLYHFSEMHRLITEAFPKEIKISLVGGQWCKLSQCIYQPPVTMQELLMNG